MRTEPLAAATRQLPLPGRILHPALQMFGGRLTYPIAPRVVRSQLGFKIEIRDYEEHIQRYIYWLGRFEPRESAVVETFLNLATVSSTPGLILAGLVFLLLRSLARLEKFSLSNPSAPPLNIWVGTWRSTARRTLRCTGLRYLIVAAKQS